MQVRVWAQRCESKTNEWVNECPPYIFDAVEDFNTKIYDLVKKTAVTANSLYNEDLVVRYIVELSPVAGIWSSYATFGPYNTGPNQVEMVIDAIRTVIEKV